MYSLIPILRTSKRKEKRGLKNRRVREIGGKITVLDWREGNEFWLELSRVRTNESSKNPDFAKLCKRRILKYWDRNYYYSVQLCLSSTTLLSFLSKILQFAQISSDLPSISWHSNPSFEISLQGNERKLVFLRLLFLVTIIKKTTYLLVMVCLTRYRGNVMDLIIGIHNKSW